MKPFLDACVSLFVIMAVLALAAWAFAKPIDPVDVAAALGFVAIWRVARLERQAGAHPDHRWWDTPYQDVPTKRDRS